jgi:predicted GIY-YIG superfamily endonuclease
MVPYANTAKYLGMTLDTKLRWKAHVKKKREELGLRYKKNALAVRKELLAVPS